MNDNQKKPLIYLVEDDPDDQYMFNMIVDELGLIADFQVYEDGLSAYDALMACLGSHEYEQDHGSRLPDLILMDLNLPVWDGKKTLKRIKNQEDLKTLPVVIYSTSKSEHDIHDCYALGANSFISKAVEYTQLSKQIEQIFTYWFKT
jgi:CheY-like chemotaxis protein